jgi:hypothetical protein
MNQSFAFIICVFLLLPISLSNSQSKRMKPHFSLKQLMNSTYRTGNGLWINDLGKKEVTLHSGDYRFEIPDSSAPEIIYRYRMNFDGKYVFGDLNGDGRLDAIICLAEWGGGSGIFRSVNAVIDSNGHPIHTAKFYVGDQTQIDTVYFDSGLVKVRVQDYPKKDSIISYTLKYNVTERKFVEIKSH